MDQKDHIDKISHPAVGGRSPGQSIGVKLLRELLFALDHGNVWRRNTSQAKPVTHSGLLRRVKNDVTSADIEMKLHESTSAHHGINRISRSTIRSSVQVHHRFTNSVMEVIANICGPRVLKLFEQYLTRTLRFAH
jgi:hypothetical protein